MWKRERVRGLVIDGMVGKQIGTNCEGKGGTNERHYSPDGV
jgi:hypothetical protein